MRRRKGAARPVLLATAMATFAACNSRPKADGKCDLYDEGKLIACATDSSALRCNKLRLTKTPCRGPAGCAGAAVCDRSLAAPGDPCDDLSATEVCSVDRKRTLVCSDGVFVEARACAGANGCQPGVAFGACDESVGEPGQPCTGEGSVGTCSGDHKQILECTGGGAPPKWKNMKFAVKSACPTPKGCQVVRLRDSDLQAAMCDYRGSAIGAPCADPYLIICSADNTAPLRCDAITLTFVLESQCAKGTLCKPRPGEESFIRPDVSCVPKTKP